MFILENNVFQCSDIIISKKSSFINIFSGKLASNCPHTSSYNITNLTDLTHFYNIDSTPKGHNCDLPVELLSDD